jgi:ADP-heptose:LPS heptosyltransferase
MLRDPKFLVIRRDNIGDLVCTTPLFSALRSRYPQAWISALVNRYNAPVLRNNPNLSAVFSYQKAKHRARGESLAAIYWERLRLIVELRRLAIDFVILAAPALQASAVRFARAVKPRHVIGFAGQGAWLDTPVPPSPGAEHQVETIFRLLQPLEIQGPPPPLCLIPDPDRRENLRALLPVTTGPIVGVHISAREADRRWPDSRFHELIGRILAHCGGAIVLTWAPGNEANPYFPGDDASAQRLANGNCSRPVVAMPTPGIADLIASLSLCDCVICSDGGPVHLAAALGKPVLCFFGSEDRRLWYPWGVPYELLQRESRLVRDIEVEEAWAAFRRLLEATALRATIHNLRKP